MEKTKGYTGSIKQRFIDYIENPTLGALLFNGNWGSGKTFFIKNRLLKDKNLSSRMIYFSLFGISTIIDLQKTLIKEIERTNISNNNISLVKTKQKILELPIQNDSADLYSELNHYIDILLPNEWIIIIDDLERVSPRIDANTLAGFVNFLTGRKNHVIIASNIKEIKEWDEKNDGELEKHLEKITSDILEYRPSVTDLLPEILNVEFDIKRDSKFIDFITENKDILSTKIEGAKDIFSNLRCLIFSLHKFRPVFDITPDSHKRNVWTFVHAISLELKHDILNFTKTNIDEEDFSRNNNKLDTNELDFATDIDIDNLFSLQEDSTDKRKEENQESESGSKSGANLSIRITNTYYIPYNITPIFFQNLYEYVTGRPFDQETISIDFEALKKQETSQAYKILAKVENGDFYFQSNTECEKDLNVIWQNLCDSQYDDTKSFIHIYNVLRTFHNILNKTEEEITQTIKDVISKTTFTDNSDSLPSHLITYEEEYTGITEIKKILREKWESQAIDTLSKQSEKEFHDDFKKFWKQMRSGNLVYFDTLISNPNLIESKFKAIEPFDIPPIENFLDKYIPIDQLGNFNKIETRNLQEICIKMLFAIIESKDNNTVATHILKHRTLPMIKRILIGLQRIHPLTQSLNNLRILHKIDSVESSPTDNTSTEET